MTATGNAVVLLVGASIMLLLGLASFVNGRLRQALLIGLAAACVAVVVALLLSRGNFLRGPSPAESFLRYWLWQEDMTGDRVWFTVPTEGPASMQGTDFGGQLRFRRQFDWSVEEGKIKVTSGVQEATGELM